MTSKVLTRISAVLIFIHLLGHSVGHFTWDKPKDSKMTDVVTSMKSYSAEFMGATKSMADYYSGYSLIMFGLFAMTIVVLWILSSNILTNQRLVKHLLLPIGIVYIYFGIVEYLHFFSFAASLSFIAGFLTIFSTFKLKIQN